MSELNLGTYLGLETVSDPAESENKRVKKARTEAKLVVPFVDSYGYATGVYLIVSKVDTNDPSSYQINMDSQGGREDCKCPDMRIHKPNCGCKHINRIGIQMTEGNLPKPGEPAEPYMEWLAEQKADLLERKSELAGGEMGDSDALRRVSFTLHNWSKALEQASTDDISEEETGAPSARSSEQDRRAEAEATRPDNGMAKQQRQPPGR